MRPKPGARWAWHEGFLRAFRQQLLKQEEERREESGRPLENRAMDKSDAACAEFEHEVARALWTVEDNLRCEVDEALERLRNGTYGYCECTGRPISLRRLHAVPWARYCSEVESGLELARSRSREEFSRDRRLTRD
jgi:DnaK suppressor protein